MGDPAPTTTAAPPVTAPAVQADVAHAPVLAATPSTTTSPAPAPAPGTFSVRSMPATSPSSPTPGGAGGVPWSVTTLGTPSAPPGPHPAPSPGPAPLPPGTVLPPPAVVETSAPPQSATNPGAPTAPAGTVFPKSTYPELAGLPLTWQNTPLAAHTDPGLAAPELHTPRRPDEHDLVPDARKAAEGKITADPEALRDWSTTFSSGQVYTPLVNAHREITNLAAVARPGTWPEALSLDVFLQRAGEQIAGHLEQMQAASLYLSDALKAVADLQDKHETDRSAAAENFGTAVDKLQHSTGLPSVGPANPGLGG